MSSARLLFGISVFWLGLSMLGDGVNTLVLPRLLLDLGDDSSRATTLGVLTSVVGCYYYLMIVKVMYFDDPAPAFDPMGRALRTTLAVAGLFVLLFFVYPGPLVEAAGTAARSLF